MERLLTIFTPAYNRADLLPRCYESMKRQTCKNFVWLIVDDGSTDGTRELIEQWMKMDHEFDLQYCYKENGGLHTAYNEAIARIDTPLSVCIDSDDFMPDSAVETILDFWEKFGSDEYAGIVGLDAYLDGTIIGDKLPEQKSINLIDLLVGKYHIKNGDRTNVVRTELYKRYAPMKVYPGEKNFNPHYMHLQISREYDFLVLNQNLHYVEYQPNGMSNSMLKQYKNSPNSFADTRLLYLSFPNTSFLFKFKHMIHFVSSCILSGGKRSFFREAPSRALALVAAPFGMALAAYIKCRVR